MIQEIISYSIISGAVYVVALKSIKLIGTSFNKKTKQSGILL